MSEDSSKPLQQAPKCIICDGPASKAVAHRQRAVVVCPEHQARLERVFGALGIAVRPYNVS